MEMDPGNCKFLYDFPEFFKQRIRKSGKVIVIEGFLMKLLFPHQDSPV